jgi:hypothetical protein
VSSATLVIALTLALHDRPATPCSSALILDRLWRASFSAVEQEVAEARGDGPRLDRARLEYHVSTLDTISGIEASGNYFGYLPDDLRPMIGKWRDWYSRRANSLCAPLGPSGPRVGDGDPVGRKAGVGCAGQQRLTRLWLDNLRSLERILQSLEDERPISVDRFEELTRFFSEVSGLPPRTEVTWPLGIFARLNLITSVDKWQDWFAANVGAMCD